VVALAVAPVEVQDELADGRRCSGGAETLNVESSRDLAGIIGACVWALVALVVLKFVALLAQYDWDPGRAPWGLLVIIAVPALGLTLLLRKRARAGAAVVAVLMALFGATVIAALARDGLARQAWADYPFAYGGLVVAAVAIACAVKLWRTPSSR
jgi:hypothetical protein